MLLQSSDPGNYQTICINARPSLDKRDFLSLDKRKIELDPQLKPYILELWEDI